ncbi:TonB-dependent receptor [Bradyrhizobium sp. 180]|uniref:TonB-dependent receptor n=1 Tax=unclassified Bradyrhizobium TaxID=2631580 RepID=UPI001FFC168B|nr:MULTISPECIES: TonB-dependent receptor [unclassified Bradyrhizobium]MCK1423231.1 TonB-dependent receptor [Bradyrhizobium sp. CW12]MCK1493050.1 TonB-dependent receptor [Bradyrhizobium sp. 180]MCK1531354.1 TonB-dependent receptor [Bradyrhizobium sp. 182]MCK1599217.1 TonB-dependent receptor [Bradyrhizobium sp. 164]MCK1645165.1 TonB-dependent receptor [Bradyrhizobium sp. 154]
MSFQSRRAQRLGGASLLLLGAAATPALAQSAEDKSSTEIPAVTVTAPSPIVRRAVVPSRTAGRGTRTARVRSRQQTAEATPAASAPAAPQQGVLPVVTNQFATVTVVPNEEIRREGGGQLGDLLFSKPGITGSSFAPGASSRPIIRGLDVNRVGIVENGTNAGGASDLGEDHFVPVDPLATNQIEVVRGPAALRYGSTSIGGVVSATNNRIPDAMPACAPSFQSYGMPAKAPLASAATAPCVTAETRTAFSSVDRGVESGVLLDTGGGNFAFHADAYGRTTSDYYIPSYPYLTDQSRPVNGRQPNSATRSDGASIGGSYFFQGGYIGASITQNDSLYHIPGIDGADHNTRIDAHQTKINVKGEYHPDAAAIDAVRFWAGATDYRHNEIGLADPGNPNSDGVRQTFTNKEQEIRTEVQLMPFNARFAEVTTALGFQVGHQELSAPSPDNPGTLFNGLWDPNNSTRVAGYAFNEFKFTEATRAQIAGRIEHVELHGTTPDFPADYLPDGTPQTAIARNPSFTPKSGSIGLLQDLPGGMVGSLTAQYVERAPKAAELFSRGGHDATATFDIGNPNLTIETAKSIEVGVRRATGPFRFEATVYYTHFDNFIYRRLTGVSCDDDFASCGGPDGELNQAVYSQRNANFRGGEFQSQLDVGAFQGGIWGIENQLDFVRATFSDGTNVPRIPPLRMGGGVFWRDDNWLMRVNLLHAFAQNNVAVIAETPTAGYNLLKAEVSYKTKLDRNWFGAREMMAGIVGNNLLNENIRNSVSYTKDEVLMPGIGVRAFANFKF